MQQRKLVRPHLLAYAPFAAEARRDLAQLQHEHEREIAALRRELNELRDACHDIAVVLCDQADRDLATLRKQLELALIRLTPRDGKPLH